MRRLIAAWLLLASQLVLAAPPAEEIDWDALIPADYNPMAILNQYGNVDELADDDPRMEKIMAELREAWDQAPVVAALDGRRVKIPGFVVPLEGDGKKLSEFLLVPYYGACIHVPPPPNNQVIYVRVPEADAEIRKAFDTVWVIGTLSAKPFSSDLAEAGYQMQAEQVLPYE
jgi:hypothetical protein